MPTYNQQEHESGLYRTGFAAKGLIKYAWKNFADLDLSLYKFLMHFNVKAEAMDTMMNRLHEELYDPAEATILGDEYTTASPPITGPATPRLAGLWANASQEYYAVACEWIRNHSVEWSAMIPRPCALGEEITVGSCLQCTPGSFGDDGYTCTRCPAGKFTDIDGAPSCQDCPTDFDSELGSAACYTKEERFEEDVWLSVEAFIAIVSGLLLIPILLVSFIMVKRMQKVADDRPDKESSQSGSWVRKWVGPKLHMLK
jgi:hypothetical protein